ncbi:MAG: ABC transporter substrate-binding protein, partial [Firmicutes bacterium]|nr:ABC transporter substrate-binding protein [Bacillota bacterium]
MMKKYLFILTMLAALVLAGCSGSPAENSAEDDLTPLTVCLDWTPNINHAGIYTALANGYFAEEGLDVTITQPADNYALQLVAAGQAEIGVSYQEEVTFARTEDIPVVSIAAVLQHN